MHQVLAAHRLTFFLLLSLLCLHGETLFAKQRYSQIILPFPEERDFSYRFDPGEKAFILEVQQTQPNELEAINNYDEAIIRRILFKDLGGQGTEVRMILRDDDLRVMVNSFQEPFRITLDFFDADYKESIDPISGLPLAPENFGHNESAEPSSSIGRDFPTTQAAASVNVPNEPAGRRRLLQPQPESIRTPQELLVKISDSAGGVGQAWKTFPPYIYRIQIATFKTGKSYETWLKKSSGKALSSSEALAQYAGQLYDFGHENRALIAYQKVLHESPTVFDKSAEHIWKIAEIHLGQGNLTLADGYYESLLEKHPDSPLAGFSNIRRLDIKAIRSIQEGKTTAIAGLGQPLDSIPLQDNTNLTALVALRRAYWQIPQSEIMRLLPTHSEPPIVSAQIKMKLESARNGTDSPRTSFLIESILLANTLKTNTWNQKTAKDAGDYFERYKGKATDIFRSLLLNRCESSILASVDKMLKEQNYSEVISIVESLPRSLDELRNTSSISWAAAESYRRLKQPLASLPYYEIATKKSNNKPDQFRSLFWLLEGNMNAIDNETAKNSSKDILNRLQKGLQVADRKAWEGWQALNTSEKVTAFAEIKSELERNITAPQLAATPPKILLDTWNEKLATDLPSPESAVNAKAEQGLTNSKTIYLLADLSKRFEKLGLDTERKNAKQLLRRLNLKTKQPEKDALRVWTDELTQLAEEYRRNNDYLEAGRLYALTGAENNQWEGRAEALYKGGLLLYRSGRHDEAMAAFQQAADDGNNLLYAELAKKRMQQIQR